MPLKQVWIEVTDATPGEALRGRWNNGITTVILKPDVPPTKGLWDTDRGSDIDSHGGSDHATYFWDRPRKLLQLRVTSTEQYARDDKTLVNLRDFSEIRVGLSGRGGFWLHGQNHSVTWRIQSRADDTLKQSVGANMRNAESARVHIEAAKANPERKELELNQAESLARLITNTSLRKLVMDEIASARNRKD